jgi:hypothetical protein
MVQLRCPVCEKRFDSEQTEAMPFCSRRCKQIDLGRWLEEQYALPCEPEEAAEEFGREGSDLPEGET